MGVKTALLAIGDVDLRTALRGAPRPVDDAEELVRGLLPDRHVTRIGDGTLTDRICPPDDITYATALRGAVLLCDRRFALDRPSRLPAHVLRAGADRRITLHTMDAASGRFAYGVWEHGALVRSLSLSGTRVLEDIGDRYSFELGPADDPGALGQAALRAFFGFVLDGQARPGDVDAAAVRVHGFQVEDPLFREQAARQAMLARVSAGAYRRPLATTTIADTLRPASLADYAG
ncbi:hypothetical protein J2S43_008086 [Catenuloplanes nepalensis]|uniref:DUF2285 domain-containing protein n=1 Tax=Catenuloplanes nepalensis TaxID=587533 RepID=A0ABT9N7A3_9ACTN|nr:hypothetical protein [Catenuloplanes nepalensis]MDP9799574.1 hypothetical protein [Catenuloplanes nepalensis]